MSTFLWVLTTLVISCATSVLTGIAAAILAYRWSGEAHQRADEVQTQLLRKLAETQGDVDALTLRLHFVMLSREAGSTHGDEA